MRKNPSMPDYITGLIQDNTAFIAEQKKRDSVLRMWKSVVDAIPVLLFVKDADDGFKYISANPRVGKLFNCPPESFIGKTAAEIFKVGEDLKQVEESDREVMASQKPAEFYESLHDADGRLLRFKTVKIPSVNEFGHRILIQMTIDVTELREMSESQKIIAMAFERLFSSNDLKTDIRIVLQKVCNFLGFTRGYVTRIDNENNAVKLFTSFISNNESSLFPNREYLIENIKQMPVYINLLKGDEEVSYIFDLSDVHQRERAKTHLPSLAGKIDEYNINSVNINYIVVDGKPWGSVGFIKQNEPFVQMTETQKRLLDVVAHIVELAITRRLTMKRLEHALEEAKSADKAKSFFLASMSHEIRTPLNAVIGFAELLKDSGLDNETKEDYLTSISLAGNALLQLINDILDLSKLDAGQAVFVSEKTDVNLLCRELSAVFQASATQKNLRLDFEIDKMPFLFLDQQRLRQILFNLVGNSLKFTKSGGITVSASFEKDSKIDGTFTLQVTDTGIGISPEDKKRLFEPFVQLTRMRGTNANNNGTGLGLSIVKKMMTQMGGTVELESELGKGSTFILRLPKLNLKFRKKMKI